MYRCLLAFTLAVLPAVAQDKLQTFEAAISDSHGRVVEGLTADDFQLQDNGKHYRLAVFRKNAPPVDPTPLAPHQYSNRSAHVVRGATLILLDLLNLDVRQLLYVRGRMIAALEHAEPGDYVLLYFLTAHGLVVVQGFPPPGQAPDNHWMSRIGSLIEGSTGGVLSDADHPAATARGLQAAAKVLEPFSGRKSVVWITDGIPTAMTGASSSNIQSVPFFKQVVPAFVSGNVELYIATGFNDFLGPTGNRVSSATDAVLFTAMAEATGGKTYLDRDLDGAIKAAMTSTSRPTYTVGFYPQEWDGKSHRLQLKSVRKGIVVVAPEQYTADPNQASPAAREKVAVDRLSAAVVDANEIGLRVAIGASPTLPGAMQVQLRIDGSDIRLFRQDDQYAGQLSTTIVYYDAAGRSEVLTGARHPFRLTAEQRNAAVRDGIGMAEDRRPPASAVRIRIIVFDPNSNAAGSVTIPLTPAGSRDLS